LEQLNLGQHLLTEESIEILFETLVKQSNSKLWDLDLDVTSSKNTAGKLSNDSVQYIAKALPNLPKFEASLRHYSWPHPPPSP
jgi:hypothetical protein